MSSITLLAYFDGQHMPLIVTALSEEYQEREDWCRLSAHGLARAYRDNEPEYAADVKE